jgi:hypothetical protein
MFQDANRMDLPALLNETPPSYVLEFSQPNAMRSDTYLDFIYTRSSRPALDR